MQIKMKEGIFFDYLVLILARVPPTPPLVLLAHRMHLWQSPAHTPSHYFGTQEAFVAVPHPHPLSLIWHTGSIYGRAPPTPPLIILAHRKHLWQCPTHTPSRISCTQEAFMAVPHPHLFSYFLHTGGTWREAAMLGPSPGSEAIVWDLAIWPPGVQKILPC